MGTEKGIPDHKDITREVLWYINPNIEPSAMPQAPYLLPRACKSAGWRHKIDNLLMRVLSRLAFFPRFLSDFKAIIAFLRDQGNITLLVNDFKARGFSTLAASVANKVVHSFANWRWQTLWQCLKDTSAYLRSLAAAFDPAVFTTSRCPTGVATVTVAFRRANFIFKYEIYFKLFKFLNYLFFRCHCHRVILT